MWPCSYASFGRTLNELKRVEFFQYVKFIVLRNIKMLMIFVRQRLALPYPEGILCRNAFSDLPSRPSRCVGNVSIDYQFVSFVDIHQGIKSRKSRFPTLQSQRYPDYSNQQDCQYAGDAF
jgi:hypothetical protein